MRIRSGHSLTLRTALLFAVVAAVVVSTVGVYLFMAMQHNMHRRSDLDLIGRVQRYRTLVQDMHSVGELQHANPSLFENMLGDEQDVLIFQPMGAPPVVDVNPDHVVLPPLTPVPLTQNMSLSAVRADVLPNGTPLHAVATLARTADGTQVEILAAHQMIGETRMLRHYLWQIAFAVLAAFLSIALLGWVALRRGLRPLSTLASQAARITPSRLEVRLDPRGIPHELAELTGSVNAMLDRLADGYQRLAQFSADLAHEIRTPIGSLMGGMQVALYQPRSADEYETLLASSMEQLERISRLIENILFLARADNPQSALSRTPLALPGELSRVADYFEGIAEERNIRLHHEGSGEVLADAILFRRALGNLVSNAIRYGDEGSEISMRARVVSDVVEVTVENTGTPIAPEQIDKLFDRFYQADASRSSDSHSNGLGLAIVRAIMSLHGGTVVASSLPERRTRFVLRYPR